MLGVKKVVKKRNNSIDYTKMLSNELVVKSNKLIEAGMNFTANEYKLITHLVGKIQKNDREFRTFDISIKELNKNCLGIEGTKTYNYVRNKYARTLSKKDIIIYENKRPAFYNWFTIVKVEKGFFRVCFSPELEDFLLKTKNNFTVYRLENLLKLNSYYAMRIYELSKQYEKLGKRKISIEDLKFVLGIENKYERYKHLKSRVLEPSIEAINKYTDIKITYEECRIGRICSDIYIVIVSQYTYHKCVIDEIKNKLENVLNARVSFNILEKTMKKHKILKEDIYYYLDNWNAFSHKSKKDPVGFLLSCVINKVPVPKEQVGFNKPEQSRNFDQREYDDDFFESLYDN
jgi:plasmid replication initiation protein